MTRAAVVALMVLISALPRTDDAADATFAKLLESARADPTKCDYAKLRAAFVESSKYHPYAVDREATARVMKAVNAEKFPDALKEINAILEKKPLDIEAHKLASFIHFRMDDKAQEARHMAMAKGLLAAITSERDGKSFDTAYIVLDIPEEYVVLDYLDVKSQGQSLRTRKGKFFDVHEVKDAETGKVMKLYFDVTTPRKALGKLLLPKE